MRTRYFSCFRCSIGFKLDEPVEEFNCVNCSQLADPIPVEEHALCEHCGNAYHPSDMHWVYEAYLARSHSRA